MASPVTLFFSLFPLLFLSSSIFFVKSFKCWLCDLPACTNARKAKNLSLLLEKGSLSPPAPPRRHSFLPLLLYIIQNMLRTWWIGGMHVYTDNGGCSMSGSTSQALLFRLCSCEVQLSAPVRTDTAVTFSLT